MLISKVVHFYWSVGVSHFTAFTRSWACWASLCSLLSWGLCWWLSSPGGKSSSMWRRWFGRVLWFFGTLTKNELDRSSMLFMGKSTISMGFGYLGFVEAKLKNLRVGNTFRALPCRDCGEMLNHAATEWCESAICGQEPVICWGMLHWWGMPQPPVGCSLYGLSYMLCVFPRDLRGLSSGSFRIQTKADQPTQ